MYVVGNRKRSKNLTGSINLFLYIVLLAVNATILFSRIGMKEIKIDVLKKVKVRKYEARNIIVREYVWKYL